METMETDTSNLIRIQLAGAAFRWTQLLEVSIVLLAPSPEGSDEFSPLPSNINNDASSY
jgi:hypothetical protein